MKIEARFAFTLADVRRRDPGAHWTWAWIELAGAAAEAAG